MTQDAIVAAFRAEAERLAEAVAAEPEAAFTRPTLCPPWTVGDLLFHIRVGAGRIPGLLAAPEPDQGAWSTAVDYYRPDERRSPAVNADRIATAQRGAAALGSGPAILADYGAAWRASWEQARLAPPGRAVRTRHGDRMLLTEYLRTRVLELAVHGLDLAAGLGRPPWMTSPAAEVTTALLVPDGSPAALLAATGWDPVTFIAKTTGRLPQTAAEQAAVRDAGVRTLALG